MISKEEIENKDMILAIRIKRVFDYIEDEIKEKGEISQFKEDVLYIIHELLERQLSKDELTACEIVVKNRKAMIQVEKEKRTQEYIQQLENKQQKVIEKLKKEKKKNNEIEFMPLQIEKAYNNYYKLGKIDEIDEILEIMRGET